jgi:hypothetical protein
LALGLRIGKQKSVLKKSHPREGGKANPQTSSLNDVCRQTKSERSHLSLVPSLAQIPQSQSHDPRISTRIQTGCSVLVFSLWVINFRVATAQALLEEEDFCADL